MADRDITVDVTIRSDTKGAKAGAAALGDIDRAAGDAGKSMKKMEVDSKALTAQIDKSKTVIKDLEAELTKVGNNPGLRKSLRIERSWLSELEKVAKSVAEEGKRAGDQFMDGLFSGFKGSASTPVLGPVLIAAASVAALAAAPAIGAMISGAVVGAVGAGGIAGGIAAATSDSSVKAAWKDFTSSLSADDFGKQAFIEPTKAGIAELQKGFDSLDLDKALSKGAAAVPVLARGVSDFANNIMPGFNAVMSRSGEISGIMATGLGDLGGALGTLIYDVTTSEGAMDGLRSIFAITSIAIKGTGSVLSTLSDGYHELLRENIAVIGSNAELYKGVPILGDAYGDLNKQLREMAGLQPELNKHIQGMGTAVVPTSSAVADFGQQLEAAKKSTLAFQDSLITLENTQLSVDKSTLAWKQDVKDLTDSVKEHGHSTKDNTDEGLKNQAMIQGLIGDALRMADATKAATGSTDEANKVYNDQIGVLTVLLQKLGFTKAQIDALVGNHYVNIITTYATGGNASAINKNLRAEDRFDNHRAAGGPVKANVPYVINERGSETVTFPGSATVHPAHLTPLAAAGGTNNYYSVTVNASPLSSPVDVGAAAVAAIRQYEMANGSGWRA